MRGSAVSGLGRAGLVLVLLCSTACRPDVASEPAGTPQASDPPGGSSTSNTWGNAPLAPARAGFREAVLSVSDLERTKRTWEEVFGWQILLEGELTDSEIEFWGLRPTPGAAARFALLRNPGDTEGHLRLIDFSDGFGERQRIRPSARSWDTGGIFDVNVRVANIHATFHELMRRGWHAYSEPVEFSFGPFVVREVLMRGPDDDVLAMIERVAPTLEGWPNMAVTSHIFNATQVVHDFEAAMDALETLGFELYLEHEGASAEPGPNVLGMPHNIAAEVPRRVTISSPTGENLGSIEVLTFDGLTGADFSVHAKAPNLGWLALRFPVQQLAPYANQLGRELEVRAVALAPYGDIDALAVTLPEGSRLEFLELEPVRRSAGLEPAD